MIGAGRKDPLTKPHIWSRAYRAIPFEILRGGADMKQKKKRKNMWGVFAKKIKWVEWRLAMCLGGGGSAKK